MKRILPAVAIVGLALTGVTGCSGSDDKDHAAKGPIWPSTGKPVSTYKGDPTYHWRVNLLDHKDAVDRGLEKLGRQAPGDYNDLLNTCAVIKQGGKPAKQVKLTKQQYGLTVDKKAKGKAKAKAAKKNTRTAKGILALAKKQVCPK